jgi:transposase
MIENFVDLCTYVYVVTDEAYQRVVAPYDTRPGPRSGFTDSELLTVSIVAELVGLDAETRCLAYLRRNHPGLFPLLPERSRYNRRRRGLAEATNRLRGAVMERLWLVLEAEGADLCAIDSVPVPAVGFHHARHDHRWYGEAAYGRVASKKQTIYGFKLHLLVSACGLILDFALVAANEADGTLAEQLLIDKAGLTVLGDKGYVNAPLHQLLAWRNGLTVLTPRRRNQKQQLPEALTRAINEARQIVETVNSQLVNQLALQRNRAKSVWGLATRLHAKLAAHTLGMYLNYRAARPLLALMDLALI